MSDGQNSKTKKVPEAFLTAGKRWRTYGRAYNGYQALRCIANDEALSHELRAELWERVHEVAATIAKVEAALPHGKKTNRFNLNKETKDE